MLISKVRESEKMLSKATYLTCHTLDSINFYLDIRLKKIHEESAFLDHKESAFHSKLVL